MYTTRILKYLPFAVCALFFLLYATLLIIKHLHYQTGYDLAIIDQVIWEYSRLKTPITTVHAYPFTLIFTDHVELIWILLSPLYWLMNNAIPIIIAQAFFFCASGIPVYLLARKKQLKLSVSLALLISYLLFYGVQNALWSDVHSLVFGIAFMSWFIYFLDQRRYRLATIFLILTIICKEDMGLLTGLISLYYFFINKQKQPLIFLAISAAYVGAIFFIYYPYFTKDGYRFSNAGGLLSNIDLRNFYNTSDKRDVLFYSSAWFGFLPFLLPQFLLVPIVDLAHYFVLGSNYVTSAQGMFLHYRISLALLLVWVTIFVIAKFKRLNSRYVAVYLLVCALLLQYVLHLPLSYFAKRWFWTPPTGTATITQMIQHIPSTASLVTQSNITPHVTHRDLIFTLWPDHKTFSKNSPCGKPSCDWFHWVGKPEYLLADTSPDWDARHMLTNRENFIAGLTNLEKMHVIKKQEQLGTTTLYKVLRDPEKI